MGRVDDGTGESAGAQAGGLFTPEGVAAGGEKSRPSLIAGFLALNYHSPSYFNYSRCPNGDVCSVDMVRLRLSFMSGKGEWLSSRAQTFDCDEASAWVSKIRPGGWRELWSFKLGESSVALGIGFMEPGCRVNMNRGFLEFNPNKVAGDPRFFRLLERLAPCVSHAELKRFDMAYDVPLDRRDCRLSKDRRMYKCVVSDGITEYLGVKNKPGYVKVYDKAAELGLAEGVRLTRIELTCDGAWGAGEVAAAWPQVHGWKSDESARDWVRVVGIMLAEKAERGEDIEALVNMLNRRGSRPKVREFLRTPLLELPDGCAEAVIAEARSWCGRLA